MHKLASTSVGLIGALALLTAGAMAQTPALSLTGGSGTPGNDVIVGVNLTAGSTPAASVQWDISYSSSVLSLVTAPYDAIGTAGSAAGKSAACNAISAGDVRCIISGLNQAGIGSGAVATLTFKIAAGTTDTSTPVSLVSTDASDANGNSLGISGTGATVTIDQPAPVLSTLNCSPGAVTPPATSTCTVGLSSAAQSTTTINLSSALPQATVPASVTIMTGLTSTTFTVNTMSVTASTPAQISATLASTTLNFSLTLVMGTAEIRSDFNNDGHPDIVWQNPVSGATMVYYLDGAEGTSMLGTGSFAGANSWHIVAVADFNLDGHPDLVWQDPITGESQIWFMGGSQGTTLLGTVLLTSANSWRIVAASDFNLDGHPDLVWQDPVSGHAQIWYLGGPQGASLTGAANLTLTNTWNIVGASDFNGDGQPDILWQDPVSGATQVWYLGGAQGNVVMSAADLTAGSTWRIVAVADFNLDGHPDVAWQDPVSGESQVWYLGGAQGISTLSTSSMGASISLNIAGPR